MTSLTVLPNEVQPINPLVEVFNAVIDGVTQMAVNARDLHKFLKVGRDFSNWIKGRISQYIFIENQDYILTLAKTGERKNVVMTEYHLTLDMAKELAMVENNEEGRKIRRYFIRCEKELLKSDSKKRELLVSACTKLSVGNMSISDVYKMVGKEFGSEDGIKGIPSPLLLEATVYVYEMILRLNKPTTFNHKLEKLLNRCVENALELSRLANAMGATEKRNEVQHLIDDLWAYQEGRLI